jgi:hypothetical protein
MRTPYLLPALLLMSAVVAVAQQSHLQIPITASYGAFDVDLTNNPSVAGTSITIRNNGTTDVAMPWVNSAGSMPPLSAQVIVDSVWSGIPAPRVCVNPSPQAKIAQMPLPGLKPTSQTKIPQLTQLRFTQKVKTAAPASVATCRSVNDEQFAIGAWQYVVDRSFAYCSAGSPFDAGGVTVDPIQILYGYGFGCCNQVAEVLGWIWTAAGYQSRVAVMNFHTVPEIFYNGAWHMLDPDHRVIYRNADGSIASVAQILANTSLVANTADANGLDPVGWPATEMAQLYAQNASTLRYQAVTITTPAPAEIVLHPRASLSLLNDNSSPQTFYNFTAGAAPIGPHQVDEAVLDWPVRYADSNWRSLTISSAGVSPTTASDGRTALIATTSSGSLIYKLSSPFPITGLQVKGEFFATAAGSVSAAFSADGVHWSAPVPFQMSAATGIFLGSANLTQYAAGAYSYFIRLSLNSATAGVFGVYGFEFVAQAQMAPTVFPSLTPGSLNRLEYHDISPEQQARNLSIEIAVPFSSAVVDGTASDIQLTGLSAESLIPESPQYSVAAGYSSANLIDGNSSTLAYPGASDLDYVIHLNGVYQLSQVSLWWGNFGVSPYVSNWTLYSRLGANQPWQVLQSGNTPNVTVADLPVATGATDIRITASSSNWIGLYEVQVYGHEILQPYSDSSRSVTSNIPQNPTYSLAAGYSAANLIDGNLNTLAYPGSHNLDYQVSLGSTQHVTAANVTWGAFGNNPIYVSSWSILGLSNGSWTTLESGGAPGATSTSASFDAYVSDLRLVAYSAPNWIGAYEFEIASSHSIEPVTVSSNIAEWAQYAQPDSNLVDGNENTFAYPGRVFFDYQLDFGSNTFIDNVKLVWGVFGNNPVYISSWTLYGQRDGDSEWVPIVYGGCPYASATLVGVGHTYRQLRISASSNANWIGMYEFETHGVNAATANSNARRSLQKSIKVTADPELR